MNNASRPKRYKVLYPIAIVTTLLLIASIYLAYDNSKTIKESRQISEEAREVSVNTTNILRALHLSDLGLRGHALVPDNPQIRGASVTAKEDIKEIFNALDTSLISQDYSYLMEYENFKNHVFTYLSFVDSMFFEIDEGRVSVFQRRLSADPGYPLYLEYLEVSGAIFEFEDQIITEANAEYEAALTNAYLIQIIIFILAVPLLFYGAYRANQFLKISERLTRSESERRKLLAEQNVELERKVHERTLNIQRQNEEIQAQNEEIQAQNEEITAHNEQLEAQRNKIEFKNKELKKKNNAIRRAKEVIESQKAEIELINKSLEKEVEKQTADLRNSNAELIEHNNRLKQFSYIVSHNMRSPVASLLGLGHLLANSSEDQEQVLALINKSVNDLDRVIRDLNLILEIDEGNTRKLSNENIQHHVKRMTSRLKPELETINGSVEINLNSIPEVPFLSPYMESIIYNLLSNAIKYRDSDRSLQIKIEGRELKNYVELKVSDNGMGIDLAKFKPEMFKLYKRFHNHVEGKGLGLFLIKTQIESLGGTLDVESEVGVGTTFILKFRKKVANA